MMFAQLRPPSTPLPFLLTILLPFLLAFPTPATAAPSQTSAAATVTYQFPNGTWVENIAARPNTDLLVTLLNRPEVQLLPASNGYTSASLVYSFPNATACLGITAIGDDEFAVLVGKYADEVVLRSFSVWRVKLGGVDDHVTGRGGDGEEEREEEKGLGVSAEKIADIYDIIFPNGLTTLNAARNVLLISDSTGGQIWSLDMRTGEYGVLLEDPNMKPTAGESIGINGVRAHVEAGKTFIYYDNMTQFKLIRVQVDPATGQQLGDFETTDLKEGTRADDFSVSDEGVVYISANQVNQIVRVSPTRQVKTILGGLKKRIVEGATSSVLSPDEKFLYVTTSGGSAAPIDGYVEGGKVVKVCLSKL